MARFGRSPIIGRVIVLLILILAMGLGGMLWFDYLGLIDVKNVFRPFYSLVGMKPRTPSSVPTDAPGLLDDDRLRKQVEAVDLRAEELGKREEDLKQKENELSQKVSEITDRQNSMDEQEKSFNEKQKALDNRKVNIEQNAKYLTGMPPAKAVDILKAMDDQDIIDTLRTVEDLAKKAGEDSIVPFWLSLLPADRAAGIQRKMSDKPLSLE
jgi:flagellar protein FlbB